jgi:hypothetical protein
MDPFFAWIENSALGTFIRETPSVFVYPAILTAHTLGMAVLAGGSIAINLRILGFAPGIALAALQRFFPLLWLALAVNAVSGVLLLIAYPTKALTNPVFYLKLALVVLALFVLRRIETGVLGGAPAARGGRLLAAASLACWIATIIAGRLLAYTYRWEMLGIPAIT